MAATNSGLSRWKDAMSCRPHPQQQQKKKDEEAKATCESRERRCENKKTLSRIISWLYDIHNKWAQAVRQTTQDTDYFPIRFSRLALTLPSVEGRNAQRDCQLSTFSSRVLRCWRKFLPFPTLFQGKARSAFFSLLTVEAKKFASTGKKRKVDYSRNVADMLNW